MKAVKSRMLGLGGSSILMDLVLCKPEVLGNDALWRVYFKTEKIIKRLF